MLGDASAVVLVDHLVAVDGFLHGRGVLEVVHGAAVVPVLAEFRHGLLVGHLLIEEVVGGVVEGLLLDLLLLAVDQSTLQHFPHILYCLINSGLHRYLLL